MKTKLFLTLFSLFLATLLIVSCAPAVEPDAESVTWELKDGTLTISGEGEMDDYYRTDDGEIIEYAPWFDQRESIKSVIIEDGITKIGNGAFNECTNLTRVTIPESVTVIDMWAFNACRKLPDVTLPDRITYIDTYAFCDCSSIEALTIPRSLTEINENAFLGCTNLKLLRIENSEENLNFHDEAFPETEAEIYVDDYNWSFEDGVLTIPPGEMPDYYLGMDHNIDVVLPPWYSINDMIEKVVFSDGAVNVGEYAFSEYPNLKSIEFSDTVCEIGYDAFNRCLSLTEVKLPGNITSIGYGAFSVCQALTSVTIENSDNNVTIERHAFYACPLTSVIIENSEENVTIEDGAFPDDVMITFK